MYNTYHSNISERKELEGANNHNQIDNMETEEVIKLVDNIYKVSKQEIFILVIPPSCAHRSYVNLELKRCMMKPTM